MRSDNITSLALILLFRLTSLFPLTFLRKVGRFSASLLFLFHSTTRRTVEVNIAHCFPQMDSQQQQQLVRLSMEHYLQTVMEIAAIWCWPKEKRQKLVTHVSGVQLLEATIKKQQGVIVLTPHLGNWEVVGDYLASMGALTVLYAPSPLARLDNFIYQARTKGSYSLAPTNMKGVKTLMKALKKKQLLGILPDQVPDKESGIIVPFFGKPALTMTLVSSLLRKSDALVLCIFARRLADNQGFEICIREALADVCDTDKEVASAALNRSIEKCVEECPEQYMWSYKRFRKRQPGMARLYKRGHKKIESK